MKINKKSPILYYEAIFYLGKRINHSKIYKQKSICNNKIEDLLPYSKSASNKFSNSFVGRNLLSKIWQINKKVANYYIIKFKHFLLFLRCRNLTYTFD